MRASPPSTSAVNRISWNSVDSRKIIREIVLKEVPQWGKRPRDEQIECWSYALAGLPMVLIASTGWGKTSAFFVPVLILRNLVQHPRQGIPKPPARPVALVVTPLVALGNAHICPIYIIFIILIQFCTEKAREIATFGIPAVAINSGTLLSAKEEGWNLIKEVCKCKWPVVLFSAERLISKDIDHGFAAGVRDDEAKAGVRLLPAGVTGERSAISRESTTITMKYTSIYSTRMSETSERLLNK